MPAKPASSGCCNAVAGRRSSASTTRRAIASAATIPAANCAVAWAAGEIGRTAWALSGEHNRANACAALLAARHVGVPLARGLEALSRFVNVKRRMEVRGEVRGVTVYDDFAHHPTAIATTVAGLRRKVGNARILAVLEPRSNTMKLGTMKAPVAGQSARSRCRVLLRRQSWLGCPRGAGADGKQGDCRGRSRRAGRAASSPRRALATMFWS